MFEKKMRLDALYLFYGKMLTDKQNEIMDLFCNLDYSLGEISELNNISRQAVHDTIKRTEKVLENYENQLGLYERFSDKQKAFEKILQLIEEYETTHSESLILDVRKIIEKEIE
ncbi:YlxM family DNA-binding protein [Fusibacter bizertensis]|jgi:Uncharacterized protein conserved in bacteria|uniref:UPF0122 protein QE109_00775 n=1 Tax=Fusibacter bizertensis TaxID=1488331 RepID=A0ABT6N8B5_9FIRM|nr:YlxM family DNA-binding protein [Fusibacter bizertensis]MDH8676654.1 YlxM family DNA-binding protein [Fusibacter bizertensis]